MSLSVRENAALSALPQFRASASSSRREEAEAVREQSEALDVRTPSLETLIAALSGGNQQKVAAGARAARASRS